MSRHSSAHMLAQSAPGMPTDGDLHATRKQHQTRSNFPLHRESKFPQLPRCQRCQKQWRLKTRTRGRGTSKIIASVTNSTTERAYDKSKVATHCGIRFMAVRHHALKYPRHAKIKDNQDARVHRPTSTSTIIMMIIIRDLPVRRGQEMRWEEKSELN